MSLVENGRVSWSDQRVDFEKWDRAEYWKLLEKRRELEKRQNRRIQRKESTCGR